MLESLRWVPEKRESIDSLRRRALRASYSQLVGSLATEFPSLDRKRIETLVALTPAGILPQTSSISGRNRIFVRTDIFPGEFSRPPVLHEAVEFTCQGDQMLCRSILERMNLGGRQEGIIVSFSDYPHHLLGLIAELDEASQIGLKEYLHLFQKSQETIVEQFRSAPLIQDKITRWIVCERIRRNLISAVKTRFSLAEALFGISL